MPQFEIVDDSKDDADWIARVVPQYDTPAKALALILENASYFGFDPYYRDLCDAVLTQAQKVLDAS